MDNMDILADLMDRYWRLRAQKRALTCTVMILAIVTGVSLCLEWMLMLVSPFWHLILALAAAAVFAALLVTYVRVDRVVEKIETQVGPVGPVVTMPPRWSERMDTAIEVQPIEARSGN